MLLHSLRSREPLRAPAKRWSLWSKGLRASAGSYLLALFEQSLADERSGGDAGGPAVLERHRPQDS